MITLVSSANFKFRLHEGVNQYALARNMGTSVQMLETFNGHTTNRAMSNRTHEEQGQAEEVVVVGVDSRHRGRNPTALIDLFERFSASGGQ